MAAFCQSPENVARQRYNQSFSSSIFAPPSSAAGPAFVPAGKRRDQTTGEMFGSYAEKDLRGCPKTFMPKEDLFSARQKKQIFLSSGVLPNSSYPPMVGPPDMMQQQQPAHTPQGQYYNGDDEDDDAVDTNMMRQRELQSKLFGRPTPAADPGQIHSRGNKLTPNDFTWNSHPEPINIQNQGRQELSHDQRAYREKCSNVFDHTSPQVLDAHVAAGREAKREELLGDEKRRNNAYYSDLFGRSAHEGQAKENQGDLTARRCKYQGNPEDKIIVHQDWTDSKTELLYGKVGERPEAPYLRKSGELHQARIFGGARSAWEPPEKLQPVSHDNSQKLKTTMTATCSEIHQAHLKSSVHDDQFYEQAENSVHWEVVELHISGLPIDADDGYVKKLCMGFDLQLVKVAAEMDPVRNLCKGRAKVMVRYNPKRSDVNGLIQKLQEARLRVEL